MPEPVLQSRSLNRVATGLELTVRGPHPHQTYVAMEANPIHRLNCILQSPGRDSDTAGEIAGVERRYWHLADQSVELNKEFSVLADRLGAHGFVAVSSAANVTCRSIYNQRPQRVLPYPILLTI